MFLEKRWVETNKKELGEVIVDFSLICDSKNHECECFQQTKEAIPKCIYREFGTSFLCEHNYNLAWLGASDPGHLFEADKRVRRVILGLENAKLIDESMMLRYNDYINSRKGADNILAERVRGDQDPGSPIDKVVDQKKKLLLSVCWGLSKKGRIDESKKIHEVIKVKLFYEAEKIVAELMEILDQIPDLKTPEIQYH